MKGNPFVDRTLLSSESQETVEDIQVIDEELEELIELAQQRRRESVISLGSQEDYSQLLTEHYKLPETQFLVYLKQHPEMLDQLLERRLNYLNENDYAQKLQQMEFWKIAFNRTPAILLTLGLEMIVGIVIAQYSKLIQKNILISSFLPILSSIAGNIGLQASTATLRALSTGHAKNTLSGVFDVVTKESLSAIIISATSAISIFLVAQVWSHMLPFATATALAILINSIIAGCMGSLGPLLFKKLGIDPALMAASMDIDGSPHKSFELKSVDGLAALIVTCTYLFFTLIVIGIVLYDVLKDPIRNITSRNLLIVQTVFLVWEILQILLNSPYCTPGIVWTTNVLGPFVLMLINIAQMQVLKAFCSLSTWLTPKVLDIMRIIDIALYFISMTGYFLYLGYLGRPCDSELISTWKQFGSAAFALVVLTFETWNAYFLLQKLHQFQGMKLFRGNSISAAAKKASRNLVLVVSFDIIMIWCGFFIYLISMFLSSNGLVIIGATVGVSHCLTIKVMNSKVKLNHMNVTSGATTATEASAIVAAVPLKSTP
ncbi:hypothetical protein HDV06_004504 [Boothiomyces sp. JEL0866]|nr:hypothetical protein HDV06_004504 [Boothiomyces sp. JEL0866]